MYRAEVSRVLDGACAWNPGEAVGEEATVDVGRQVTDTGERGSPRDADLPRGLRGDSEFRVLDGQPGAATASCENDIFAVVSVTDTLYTFYAEGIGKVAEAERQRISAMALFNTDTRVGKVLVAFTPTIKLPPVEPVQAP
ncbi:MAG: hypothetical protein DMF98_27095 [Acidobacteria bacterium]|nr:MAG: hypothetical protein DMF98_27095 [Acidobacteriota bacterium]